MSAKTPAAELRVRFERSGAGHLRIYTRIVNGIIVWEAFTLQSLSEVLGIPPSTLEGRYQRGCLHHWKLDIPTGETRPVRGFPLAMLEQVTAVLTTPGARVMPRGNEDHIESRYAAFKVGGPMRTEMIAGERVITMQCLCEHYGRSMTTIRGKLQRSGMMRKAKPVRTFNQSGGRPRLVWSAALEQELRMAVENGAEFYDNEVDEAVRRATFNPTMARPVNTVNPTAPDPDTTEPAHLQGIDEVAATINALLAGTDKVPASTAGCAVQLDGTVRTFSSHGQLAYVDEPDPQDDMKTGALAFLRAQGWSEEAAHDVGKQLRDGGASEALIEEVLTIAASARATAQRTGQPASTVQVIA